MSASPCTLPMQSTLSLVGVRHIISETCLERLSQGFHLWKASSLCQKYVYGAKAAIHGKEVQSIQPHHTGSYKLTTIYINDIKCLRCVRLIGTYIRGLSELLGLHGLRGDCRIISEAPQPPPHVFLFFFFF